MYKPLSDHLSVNLCSPLNVYICALSTMNAVPFALVLPSSFDAIGPLIVSLGHSFRMLTPTGLTAGCVSGMIALVKRPPVAIDPVPAAGHRALATPPRHHGLYRTTGLPPDVVCEKSPLRWFRLGQISEMLRVVPERYPSVATQKKVRFFTTGPPTPPP